MDKPHNNKNTEGKQNTEHRRDAATTLLSVALPGSDPAPALTRGAHTTRAPPGRLLGATLHPTHDCPRQTDTGREVGPLRSAGRARGPAPAGPSPLAGWDD